MPQLYAAGRRQVKNYLGYTLRHDFCLYTRQKASPCHRRLLATDTRREPTVFDAVMRTYLACWQGNFGLIIAGVALARIPQGGQSRAGGGAPPCDSPRPPHAIAV